MSKQDLKAVINKTLYDEGVNATTKVSPNNSSMRDGVFVYWDNSNNVKQTHFVSVQDDIADIEQMFELMSIEGVA